MAKVISATQEVNEADPLTVRRMQADLEAAGVQQLAPLSSNLTEKRITVKLSCGIETKIKLIHPVSSSSKPRPLFVLFYGGGFRAGSCDMLTEPGRTYASYFNAVVVLGSYRMVPEVRWPVPWKDSWQLLVHLSQHASESEWGGAELDPQNGGGFVVGGVSAGASIAAVCACVDALDRMEDGIESLAAKITGVLANVPWLLVPEIVPQEYADIWKSWTDNEYVEGFNLASLKSVMKGIACTDYTSPWFSPIPDLLRDSGPLKNYPRVYVTTCQMDPIRDDGQVYCKVLQHRGVEVRLVFFPDDGHNAWTVVPLPRRSKNPTFEKAAVEGVRWLLRVE